ncbi:MAG: hypothetical protein F6K24_06255 [Okeania sp. SIO2D1]|nr:hypothetical protein [Okeania sp. SIO2D1]
MLFREGRRKKEEGRGKKEEGRGKKTSSYLGNYLSTREGKILFCLSFKLLISPKFSFNWYNIFLK